jgi:RNA 2',3'-cyclic 3'-phosphodiesterase
MTPTPAKTRRLFFGLDASAQRQPLVRLQQQLALAATPVAAENLHLTLLFLGAVSDVKLPQLYQLGHQVALQHGGFEMELDTLGLFPQAKVAWIGVSQPPTELLALELALRAGVSALGLPLDPSPYRPHITLYRKARTLPEPDARARATISLQAREFHLYESCSTPAGVQYCKLASWEFAVTDSSAIAGSKVDG